jgi:ligand-binding SRPBCC domain-containing protein
MLRMTKTACVDAPLGVVWAHLARIDQIHLWIDMIHRSYVSGDCSAGIGAVRTCELRGDRRLHEHFVAWDEGVSFTYESRDAPMMKLARNRWSVRAEGDRTLVTSEAEMRFRGGPLGWLLGFLLVPLIRVLLPNPLAKFKFWVEHGRPYEGKAWKPPRPAPLC